MKGIGFIFLIFSFGVGSIFGQIPNNNPQVIDSQQSNFEHGKSPGSALIAQDGTAPNVEEASKQTETTGEGQAQWKKARRIFKIINDYQLTTDEILTTLVVIAADAKLQGRVTGNVLVIGGDVQLSPEAQVNGTLHIIGGWAEGNYTRRCQPSNKQRLADGPPCGTSCNASTYLLGYQQTDRFQANIYQVWGFPFDVFVDRSHIFKSDQRRKCPFYEQTYR